MIKIILNIKHQTTRSKRKLTTDEEFILFYDFCLNYLSPFAQELRDGYCLYGEVLHIFSSLSKMTKKQKRNLYVAYCLSASTFF
jgi:hypothetical protein